MKKRFLHRFTLAMSLVMAGFFGFPGLALADANISNTGPDSYNKIDFNNTYKCDVENNNHIKAINHVDQNAQTGDAVVGGSDWHKYDPAAWKARGASQAEWKAAVSSYMADYKWNGSGGGNTTGGDATSGNASNVSNNTTNIDIDNSGACAEFVLVDTNGDGKPDKKVAKKPGQVLGSSSSKLTNGAHVLGGGSGSGNGGGGHALGSTNTSGSGGGSSIHYPSTSGGAGGSGSGNSDGGHGGSGGGGSGSNDFVINHTGPDSYNKISYETSTKTSVKNNNNVFVKNFVSQSASSGSASVSGNTTGGNAGSGGAGNASGNTTGASVNN